MVDCIEWIVVIVECIELYVCEVWVFGGYVFGYDVLLLVMGGCVCCLVILGVVFDGVFVLCMFDDVVVFGVWFVFDVWIVLIGGGFIGFEVVVLVW